MQAQWFESWFDSPWYPILYSHRDAAEAGGFILKLLDTLRPRKDAHFLDLACGRGRHSRLIHAHGFEVTGMDLSAASIAAAKAHEEQGLNFMVHDMRIPFPGRYDHVLNLFTSFGYFERPEENLLVLRNVADSLRDDGRFVLDFFNLRTVLAQMVPSQTIGKQGIVFSIRKEYVEGYILKSIDFDVHQVHHHFEERVQGLDLGAFTDLFFAAGLEIERLWGDYGGGDFEPDRSPRLVIFGKKVPSNGRI